MAKVTFKVIQGHWQWCHLIGHIRFPISLSFQLYLYLAPFPRYYHLFISQNLMASHDSEHIPSFGSNITCMHALVLVSINQYTKLEVPS